MADSMGRSEDPPELGTKPSASEPPQLSLGRHVSSPGSGDKTISDRQLAANRRNSQLSTGPRSPEGKANVAQNAYKHGAYSLRTGHVRSGPFREDPAAVKGFEDAMAHLLSPRNDLEREQAGKVARAMTASRRFSAFEALFLEAVTDLEPRGSGVYLGPSAPIWIALDRLMSEEAFVCSTSLADLAPEYPDVGWAQLAAHLASELEPGTDAEQAQAGGLDEGPGAVAAILERHFQAPARARAWLDERLRSSGTAARTSYAEALAGEQGVRAMARLCTTAERVDARAARALKTYQEVRRFFDELCTEDRG